jgi:hypothetical protein
MAQEMPIKCQSSMYGDIFVYQYAPMVVHRTSSSERIGGCAGRGSLVESVEGELNADPGRVTGMIPVPTLLPLERRDRDRGGDGSARMNVL